MSYSIQWSDKAKEDVNENLSYLEEEWGEITASKFLDRLDVVLEAIGESPTTFLRIDKTRKIHKFTVNQRITLYYQLEGTTISLITFWNGRKDDKKLNKVLENKS